MTEDHTCRICRGEATKKRPLIHPCKCRGSIRYIHEDCLMEWLKHSQKSTKQCDICNTQYQFETIYDPNMPKRVPLLLIWAKFISTVTSVIVKYVLVVLYAFFLLQLPIFWKVVGRVFTFLVDGPLPAGGSVPLLLLYGISAGFDENLPLMKDTTWFGKAVYLFFNTFLSGMIHVSAFVVVLVAIFVEHEWVVRDDGYTKMLLNDIGREPRSRLIDILQGIQQAQENGGNDENGENGENAEANRNQMRPELVNEAINDLRNFPEVFPGQEELRNAIRSGELAELMQSELEAATRELPDMPANHIAPAGQEDDPHAGIDMANTSNPHEEEASDDSADGDYVYNETDNRSQSDLDISESEDDDEPIWGQGDEMGFDPPDELGEGILEIIGLKLNISTPLLLTVLVDTLVMVFLFTAYLIPHMIGNFVLLVVSLTYHFITMNYRKLTLPVLVQGYLSPLFDLVHSFYSKSGLLVNTRFFMFDVFLQPFKETMARSLSLFNNGPATLSQRALALSIGYVAGCYGIHLSMKSMISGKKPIVGNTRKVYKILFEIAATAKVFVVFAVEIFVFPVYCGWLIDFCLAPLFKTDLVVKNKDGSLTYEYLFVASLEHYNSPAGRVLIYWGFGTIYMLCFALYVGMLRNRILRPGVLFFIRSPEDPNARLIHDALVKSLRFQMLRIWLSAKFYTGNILLGIGLVTWGLRWFTASSYPDKQIFLPIPLNWSAFYHAGSISMMIKDHQQFLALCCVKFWERVFEVVCYKLRLSDFILGTPIAEERGHVVYKNWFYELFGAVPDYQHPVTYSEAREQLKQPGVCACFVPDGNYVRAPASDTSRKFIDQLFIPVTKNDQPINEGEPRSSDHQDGYESDYSDIELNYDQSYLVVYRPPDFKTRCMILVFLLGVFAQILFVFVSVAAMFPGRIFTRLLYYACDTIHFPFNPWDIDTCRVDLQSLSFGLYIFVRFAVEYYEGRPANPVGRIPMRAALVNARPAAFQNFFDFDIPPSSPWTQSLHMTIWAMIEVEWVQAERVLFGKSLIDDPFNLSYLSLASHLVLAVVMFCPIYLSWHYEKKDQSYFKFMWEAGVVDDLVFLFLFPYAELESPLANSFRYFGLYLLVKTILGGIRLHEHFNKQVILEKYVRGTAIQNVELEDAEE